MRPVRQRSHWIAALLLLCAAGVAAQRPSPDQEALRQAKVVTISGKVLNIIGITRGLDSTLRDLGAKVTSQEIKIELSADVLFDFDKYDLRPDAVPSLQKVAAVVTEYQNAPVLIEGHTDSVGSDAYNQTLAEKRAASVQDWLVKNAGVVPARVSTRGWGKSKPTAPNTKPDGSDDPEGRRKNRRVEITLKKG